jgi:hypothetical protein
MLGARDQTSRFYNAGHAGGLNAHAEPCLAVVLFLLQLPMGSIGDVPSLQVHSGSAIPVVPRLGICQHGLKVNIGEYSMRIRFMLFGVLLVAVTSACAAEQYLLKFELAQGEKVIERGNILVSGKQNTWSKGLKRSYLKLRCDLNESGRMQKFYSTTDYFSGLRVTHQLVSDHVELTVVRNIVQPRLVEIRALAKSECKDLSPIVTATTQLYKHPAKDGVSERLPFGEHMAFRATIQSLGEIR